MFTTHSSFFTLLILLPALSFAQGVGMPLQSDSYHLMDRLEIKTGLLNPSYSALKPFLRSDLTAFAVQVDTTSLPLTVKDRRNLYYIFKDNNDFLPEGKARGDSDEEMKKVYVDSTKTFYTLSEQPGSTSDYYVESKKLFLKYFYRTPANAFEFDKKSFYFKVNPLLRGTAGIDPNEDDFLFDNVRGISLRGGIDQKVYFYTEIMETQSRFPTYINKRIEKDRAVPGASLFKGYESTIIDSKGAYDYLNAQGYVGFNISKHVGLQLGHGNNFIGNGYRSLFLSDFAANYFYLKLNTRVWRFHYQNVFAELSAESGIDQPGDDLIPKKYFAAHYLTARITKNLQVGLFEAVVFSRQNHFELQYLNPVILYRSVEHLIGSPDNAMIGMDLKWNLFRRFQLYGQLIFDEFKFSELLIERNGWWANKYGIQTGIKYIDVFGIDHLDAQLEYNTVRPYTYTHGDSLANFSHYNQPLAHPIGANFREVIAKVRYQATKRLVLEGRLIQMQYGIDNDTTNWGTNILLNNETREQEYDNETAQGIKTTTQIIGFDISYQLFHNMYIDLNYFYRNQNSEEDRFDLKTNYIGGGVRINLSRFRRGDF
jgi:Capsule assembly protein Wzi